MNRRQKKKQFKKRFGINPPRGISIKTAAHTMQHREKVIAAFERIKKAILDLWEMIKQPALELATALKEATTALISNKEKTPPTVCGVAGIPNKSNNAAEAAGKRGNAN